MIAEWESPEKQMSFFTNILDGNAKNTTVGSLNINELISDRILEAVEKRLIDKKFAIIYCCKSLEPAQYPNKIHFR